MKQWILGVSVAAALLGGRAAEGHGFVAVGINLGGPFYRPYPWCGPYYRPYPVYVAPPPIYYAPPPVVYQPAPVVVQQTVPVVQPQVTRSPSYSEPPSGSWTSADVKQGDVDRYVRLLFDNEERVRGEAAMELGRMRVDRAVEPLMTLLTTDKSAHVRDSAARALGLIAAARSLGALQNAAQGDNDHEVRRSAQFSAEIIRTNLRHN